MVERHSSGGRPALDAAPVVPGEQRAAGDLALDGPRDAYVRDEPDHVRPLIRVARGTKRLLQLLQYLGLTLEDKHGRATHGSDVQRFVARIQDENLLHGRAKSSGGIGPG